MEELNNHLFCTLTIFISSFALNINMQYFYKKNKISVWSFLINLSSDSEIVSLMSSLMYFLNNFDCVAENSVTRSTLFKSIFGGRGYTYV